MTIRSDLNVQEPGDDGASQPQRGRDWDRLVVLAALIIVLVIFGVLAMWGVAAATIVAVSAAAASVLKVVLSALFREGTP